MSPLARMCRDRRQPAHGHKIGLRAWSLPSLMLLTAALQVWYQDWWAVFAFVQAAAGWACYEHEVRKNTR